MPVQHQITATNKKGSVTSVSLHQHVQRQGLIEEGSRLIHANDRQGLGGQQADLDQQRGLVPIDAA